MTRLGEPSFAEGLTDALEALAAAGLAVWRWRPDRAQLSLSGALGDAALAGLTPECSPAAFLAMIEPADHQSLERLFAEPGAPGSAIDLRFTTESDTAARLRLRGAWLESGDAAGTLERLGLDGEDGDVLTGLNGRSAFLAMAEARLETPGPWRLVVADVARLRRLNEALGPGGADFVLQALALRFRSALPEGALAGRIGEDEFAALLVEPEADRLSPEAFRQRLERPLRVKGFDIHPTLWLAETRCEGGPGRPAAPELLRRVGLALEAARSAGKNPLAAVVRPPEGDGLSRLALEADLHGALERGEIMPYYQPIAHLGSGRLAGFEALARWRHPQRGLVMPQDFLPLLADAGLMGALGRHMMTTAAAQIGAWRRAHPDAGELFVAVNLSTGELEDERLVGFVAERVRENGLAPRALKLEITESDMMRDPERAAVVLAELRQAGAGISLDDFGTGFSSLAYLTRLPFETLKIDRYFVRTMAETEGSAKIVRSVASLGRDLGLEVVAEGVETEQVARQLYAMGCEYGQGFGYAPALDPQAAEVYLNESYLDVAPIRVSA